MEPDDDREREGLLLAWREMHPDHDDGPRSPPPRRGWCGPVPGERVAGWLRPHAAAVRDAERSEDT